MKGHKQLINVNVEPRSTFTFTRDTLYLASSLRAYARKNYTTVEIHL